MAFMSFVYEEGEPEGLKHSQVVTIYRDVEGDVFIEDVLDFLGDALRTAGYTYVDQVGAKYDNGDVKWSKF